MTRVVLPCTSPTKRSICASATFKMSLTALAVPAYRGLLQGFAARTRRLLGARLFGCSRRHGCTQPGRPPPHAAAPQHGAHRRAQFGGRLHRAHAGADKRLILLRRRAFAACNDGTRMAHALARRRGDAGDVGDHGLGYVLANIGRGCLFIAAADLTDKDDPFSVGIALEKFEHLNEAHAAHRIAADAHTGTLSEPDLRRLEYRLIGERSGTRHDADRALLVYEAGHDAKLAFLRGDDARTVGPDETCRRALQHRLDAHHVIDGHAFGDAHDELQSCIGSFQDRIGGEGRGHVDHAGGGAGGAHRVGNGIKHRLSQMPLAAATRGDAADQLRAVCQTLLGMKSALASGETLTDHACVAIDQYAHAAAFLARAMTLRAASVRSTAAVIASPLDARISRALTAFVPSRRTTTGSFTPTAFTACTTPAAMMSQRTMPPKILMSTARTFGFEKMIPKAIATRSAVAPPPTSRKFAGLPPCNWIRSIVAMASPAPFTMQAISPSSDT